MASKESVTPITGPNSVPTNIKGVIIQAKSLKELKIKSKVLCNIALKHMVDVINQEGECFDLFEVESLNKN